eukprot:gene2947-3398_t
MLLDAVQGLKNENTTRNNMVYLKQNWLPGFEEQSDRKHTSSDGAVNTFATGKEIAGNGIAAANNVAQAQSPVASPQLQLKLLSTMPDPRPKPNKDPTWPQEKMFQLALQFREKILLFICTFRRVWSYFVFPRVKAHPPFRHSTGILMYLANYLLSSAIPTVYLPSKTLPTKSPSKRAKRWLVRDAFMSTPEMPMEAGEESATDLEPTSAKATVLDDEYMEAQSSQTIYDDTTTDCEKSNKVMVTLKAVRKVVNRQRRNIISLNSKIKQQGSRMNYLRKKICSVKKASPVKLACSQTSNECGSTFGSEENESDFDEDTNWYKTEEDNEGEEQEEEVGCLIDSDVDSQDGDAIDGADATRGNIRNKKQYRQQTKGSAHPPMTERKKLIKIGTPANDQLKSVILDKRICSAVTKLSSNEQTSYFESFHATLNQWH